MHHGALGAHGDYNGRNEFRQRVEILAGAFLQQLRLVIVDRDIVREPHELLELRAAEHRQPLTGVEDEGVIG